MCSIDGYTGETPFTIEQYGSLNANRGPDGTNYYKSPQISMAHSLLAIQPNESHITQPVVNELTGNVLAYNGEIFGMPNVFDTKYVMDLMDNGELGTLANRTNGMWAIAYYNRSEETLTLIRDHFGVKPLYYMELGDQLFFSSTPKPLLAALNYKNFQIHANNHGKFIWENNDRFMYGKRTPINHIKRLAPGEMRVWCLKNKRWKLDGSLFQNEHFTLAPNYSYDADEFKELAVKSIGEVCYAPGIKSTIALSGGLDSSLIAGVCASLDIPVTATSTSFKKNNADHVSVNDGMFTEAPMARKTAKHHGMKFHTSYYHEDHNLRNESIDALTVPMWDRNRIDPRYFNIKMAKKNKAKIYITGDCADELFTGYNGDNEIFHNPNAAQVDRADYAELIKTNEKWKHLSEVVKPEFLGYDAMNNKRFMRLICHGDGFATTTDHIAGSFGMESRLPFLHQELARYALRIPSAFKLIGNDHNFGGYKYLIRDVLAEYLPDHVRERQTKIGFAAPWDARDHELNIKIGQTDFDDYIEWANNIQFPVDI